MSNIVVKKFAFKKKNRDGNFRIESGIYAEKGEKVISVVLDDPYAEYLSTGDFLPIVEAMGGEIIDDGFIDKERYDELMKIYFGN